MYAAKRTQKYSKDDLVKDEKFLSCHIRILEWICTLQFKWLQLAALCSCLNVKELRAQSRRHIWSLSDCNGIRTHNHVVRKRTLNHLAKLAKWLNG